MDKDCLKKFNKFIILFALFACKGEDPLTPKMVEGALGPKYPDLVIKNVSPQDEQIGVALKPNIILNFSNSIDPQTVTVNLNTSGCVGSVQLSKNNFVTCEQLVPPISTPGNYSFTVSPMFDLSELTYYKIRVTNRVLDYLGQPLSNPYTSKFGFQTLDATPPTVDAIFPLDNMIDVDQNTGISLSFSEEMDRSSITANFSGNNCTGTFQVSKDSFFTCVEMSPPIYSFDGRNFTVYPRYPLESLRTYQVRALKQIKDKSGNNLANEYLSQGFKVKDWTPPLVQSTIPIANSTEVSFYTFISATFSKKMNPETIGGIVSGNVCAGSFQLSKDNFATCIPLDPTIVSENKFNFAFKPKSVLEPGTNYKFMFTTDVQDESGLSLENPFVASFQTSSLPIIISTNPPVGAVQVPETTTLTVTFSRAMDVSSVFSNPNSNNCNIGTFNLAKETNPNDCVPLGPVTASNNNTTFTAKPILNLQNQGSYIIKVSHLVRDNSGNELASDYVQNPGFRIYDTTPPLVEPDSSTPANNSIDFVNSKPITIHFEESMNPASMGGLNVGSTRNSCIGTIQLSSDNFINCLPFTFSQPIASNNNRDFTVKPSGDLALSNNYQIKVTTAAQDKYGNYLSSPMIINFRTIDPIKVIATNPPDSSTPLVPKDTEIRITFNRSVLNSSITYLISGNSCTGSIQLSMDNFVTCTSFVPIVLGGTQTSIVTLEPTLPLANFTNYRIRVLKSIMDENDITMASDFTQLTGFKTIDIVPPLVLNTTPNNGDTYIPRNTSLSVNFDEGMDPLTISTNSTSTECTGTLQVSKDDFSTCVQMTGQPVQDPQGMIWTMQPASILENFTYYKFRVLAGVLDTQGNAMVTSYNQNPGFQSSDDIPPQLVSSSPASGTVGVPSNSNFVLTFSEPMDVSSITWPSSSVCGTSTVQLQIGPSFFNCIPILAVVPTSSNTVFTFTPANSLGINGTPYQIVVTTTVKDAQGNRIPTILNIPFRVTDTISPSVANYAPANGSIAQSIGSSLNVTFNEEIDPSSLITNQGSDTDCTGKTWFAQVGGTCLLMKPFTSSFFNMVFSMVPQNFLPRNSTVTVTIQNVKDLSGNFQASPTISSFQTNDPAVASLVLPTTATDVLPNTPIQVGFDRTMDPSTLSLNNSGNSCIGNIQMSLNNFSTCVQFNSNLATPVVGAIYQMVPVSNLALNSTYTVRVTTGAITSGGDSWPVNQDFIFQTVIPPSIISTVPAASATNVARNTSIEITFSKSMLVSSITTNSTDTNCWGTLQLSTDNLFSSCIQMAGNPATIDNKTFILTPASNLPNESTIYLRVTTAVFDTVGANMQTEFNSSFKTKDEILPTIVSTIPTDSALNVINNSTMTVNFSEPMNVSTISVQSTSGPCSGSVQLSSTPSFTNCLGLTNLGFTSTNTTFNFGPVSNLPDATTIFARVTTAVKDLAGNAMGSNYLWVFDSNTVPNVASITPTSSATFVNLNTNIVVTFNKGMNPLTFTPNTAFDCSNGNILFSTYSTFENCLPILTQTFSASNTTTTFTVSTPLNQLSTYYFKIKNSVGDTDGMNPVNEFISSFTTGDSTPPSVISTNPSAGETNTVENLITITFSEQMATSTITVGSGTCTTGNIQVSADNFANCAILNPPTTTDNLTFNFVPSPDLSPLTSYQIKVKNQVKDLSGNNMTSNYLQVPGFTVGDYIPPTVALAAPTSTTTDAPTDASITITFSETMDPSSITSNSTNSCDSNTGFLFSNNNFTSCLPVSSPFTSDQKTYKFIPLNGLYNGVTYQYKVNTVVKDSAGNYLVNPYTNNFSVNDSGANTVSMNNPTNGALGVPFGAGVQSFSIIFSATVNSASVTTNSTSTSCIGNVQLSANNFSSCVKWASSPNTSDNLIFNLGGSADNLQSNTTYILKVKKEITTTAPGQSLKKDYMFNFKTDVSPTVVSLLPIQGGTDIPTFGPNTITVTFDTTMDSSTIVGASANACNVGAVDLSINNFATCLPLSSTSTDFKTFYLTPTSALVNNTKYHLRINSKAKSTSGNPLIGYYPNINPGQTFTTTNKPTVISTVPSNGATGVSRNPTFTINFSEPMVNVNTSTGFSCSATVQLSSTNFSNCVGLNSPSISNNNSTFSFGLAPAFPFTGLNADTNYKLKILGSVQAVRNNIPMGSDYSISFTTGSSTALAILEENLECEQGNSPPKVSNPTKINWKRSKETLVNSSGGGFEIFYQKDDPKLYCKKVPYENGEWAPNETVLDLNKGLWKIRVKSYSRLNPQGSSPSEIKEIIVN